MQWSSSYYYLVKTQGGDVVVCKQAFISIHGITAKRLGDSVSMQHQDLLLHLLTRVGNITITIALTQI